MAAMETYDINFMGRALAAAREGARRGEVPVGAIIVAAGEVVGTGYNRREQHQSPLAHAEIMAIEEASRHLGSWRLEDCDIYVTLEPCLMCAGAILQARMRRLVFACLDAKAGAVESLYRLCEDQRLNHQLSVTGGVLAQESAALLAEFFARLRSHKRQSKAERWPSPVEGA
ncbi:MAG TPA: tRNA adenosine(34) deaminase TadA [Candidatus Binatia bacterium]|jgi:tRNA(adenine34) deaminase